MRHCSKRNKRQVWAIRYRPAIIRRAIQQLQCCNTLAVLDSEVFRVVCAQATTDIQRLNKALRIGELVIKRRLVAQQLY